MFDVFDKKQIYNSVITRNGNASKDWNCLILIFLTRFNTVSIYFVFGYACYTCVYVVRLLSVTTVLRHIHMCICRKTAICFFGFLGMRSVFLVMTLTG